MPQGMPVFEGKALFLKSLAIRANKIPQIPI